MRRDVTALVGRAAVLAAGAGAVLGAGAGIASAAPQMATGPADTASFNQDGFGQQGFGPSGVGHNNGTMPQAPNLSLAGGQSENHATPTDVGTVNGDDLAFLNGTSGALSGLGSGHTG